MGKNQYKIRKWVCVGCGNKVEKRAPAGSKYCSLGCYRRAPRPKRQRGETRRCGRCGKEIYIPRLRLKKVNYCSVECHNKTQSKKVRYVCKICGEAFWWSPSRAKHNPKYCSIECRNTCPEWKRNAVVASNLAQCKRQEPTSLEVAGYKILDALGIEYEKQALVFDKFVVDVLIPEIQTVIQWDGDYWHGFGGATDDRQRKRITLDKSQDAYMRKAGYTVIRFWEHEVNDEPERVSENIRRAIQ